MRSGRDPETTRLDGSIAVPQGKTDEISHLTHRARALALGATLALLLPTLLAAAPAAGRLEGTWLGRWVREGSELEVTLRFSRSENGYAGSFDSDALRVSGIPLRKIVWDPPAVRWEVVGDATTTTFSGRLDGDAIAGRLQEGEASGTFSLARSADAPLPSRREEVTFRSGGVTLAGTIFLPARKGPHPGIVFLHGSGPEGRWASSYLAERFARQGFAALAFDKRGVGESGGDWGAASFEELAADAAAAFSALATHPDVAPGRVGIHGHSQGGTLAPLAAARIGNPAFVIASAATGLSMSETETFSVENALGIGALAPSEAAEAREFVAAIVATAYEGQPRERLIEVWRKVREKPWAFEPPPETDSYWSFSRRTAAYDALSHWRRVSAPTLLVFGEADERVPARASAARIAEAYLGGRGTSLKAVFFAGADHTFRHLAAPGGAFAWPKTAEGYPDVLLQWALEAVASTGSTISPEPLRAPTLPYPE